MKDLVTGADYSKKIIVHTRHIDILDKAAVQLREAAARFYERFATELFAGELTYVHRTRGGTDR